MSIKHTSSLRAVLHALVKNAPSSLDPRTIADMLDKPYGTLMNELNANTGHKLGADLVLPLIKITGGADEAMRFMARELGGLFYRLPDSMPGSGGLMEALADLISDCSELFSEAAQDIAKGDINHAVIESVSQKADNASESILRLKAQIRAAHEGKYGPPSKHHD